MTGNMRFLFYPAGEKCIPSRDLEQLQPAMLSSSLPENDINLKIQVRQTWNFFVLFRLSATVKSPAAIYISDIFTGMSQDLDRVFPN